MGVRGPKNSTRLRRHHMSARCGQRGASQQYGRRLRQLFLERAIFIARESLEISIEIKIDLEIEIEVEIEIETDLEIERETEIEIEVEREKQHKVPAEKKQEHMDR